MYDNVIKYQLKTAIIERVDDNSIQRKLNHCIPHHLQLHLKKTMKLQIVDDASGKTKKSNVSLNECLYHGPVILEDLCALLMRFQSQKVVFVADTEKEFLQVGLQEKDRNVTRFLWLKDIRKPVTTENTAVLGFTRIPFDVISSKFIFAATIVHPLMQKGTAVSIKKFEKDIYVNIYI